MKSKKGEFNLGIILLLVMGIIIILAIVPEIFTQQSAMTTKNTVTNEVVSLATARNATTYDINSSKLLYIANVPTGWKVDDCPVTITSWTNASGEALAANTDYVFTGSSGAVYFKNTTDVHMNSVSNTTLVTYEYCLDGYNKDSGSRSVAGLIGLFSILALAAFAISYGVKEWMD